MLCLEKYSAWPPKICHCMLDFVASGPFKALQRGQCSWAVRNCELRSRLSQASIWLYFTVVACGFASSVIGSKWRECRSQNEDS